MGRPFPDGRPTESLSRSVLAPVSLPQNPFAHPAAAASLKHRAVCLGTHALAGHDAAVSARNVTRVVHAVSMPAGRLSRHAEEAGKEAEALLHGRPHATPSTGLIAQRLLSASRAG